MTVEIVHGRRNSMSIPIPLKGRATDRVYTTLPFVPMMQTTQEGPPSTLPYVPIEVRIPEDKRRRAQVEYTRLKMAFADALTEGEVPALPLPFVPIEGEPLDHRAYREYQNSDGSIERLYWDDCRIKPSIFDHSSTTTACTYRGGGSMGESLMYEAYNQWDIWRECTMLFGAPHQRDPYDTTDGLDLTDGDRYLGSKIKQYLPAAPVTSRSNYMPPSDGVWDRGPAPDSEHTTEGEQDMNDDTTPGLVYGPYVVNPNLTYEPVSVEELEGPTPFTTYLEYLTTIKTLYATLKANGTHKQAGIALAVLSANWLGDVLYHMVPFSGVPMTVGVLCLSSLLLRSNREKLVQVLKDYVE